MIRLTLEKMTHGGRALGFFNNSPVFVWGALPGEEVEVEIIKKKKGIIEAVSREIIKKSIDRIEAQESHYLSCSPWQILKPDKESYWKQNIFKETFNQIAGIDFSNIQIDDSNQMYNYRNKMEYSFTEDDNGIINLAFFNRGGRKKISINECILARPEINRVAKKILFWINKHKIPNRSLKSLILRSNQKGEVMAGIFLKDRLSFSDLPEIDYELVGFHLIYSTHKSPASVITESLVSCGRLWLGEMLLSHEVRYGLMSFFQINIPLFERVLSDISKYLDYGSSIVDFYSGVGSISIGVSQKLAGALLVEGNEEAYHFSKENIEINKLLNYKSMLAISEKAIDEIKADRIIILDPPRSGLHKRIIERILQEKPRKIIYLSCDIATQARDVGIIKHEYNLAYSRIYNFFPRTPHIESLLILERK